MTSGLGWHRERRHNKNGGKNGGPELGPPPLLVHRGEIARERYGVSGRAAATLAPTSSTRRGSAWLATCLRALS